MATAIPTDDTEKTGWENYRPRWDPAEGRITPDPSVERKPLFGDTTRTAVSGGLKFIQRTFGLDAGGASAPVPRDRPAPDVNPDAPDPAMAAEGAAPRPRRRAAPAAPAIPVDKPSAAAPMPRAKPKGAQMLAEGVGAATPEEMAEINSLIDPEGKMTLHERAVAAVNGTFGSFTSQGKFQEAEAGVASVLIYQQKQSAALAGQAVQAAQAGDWGAAVQFLEQAYQSVPDGADVDVNVDANGNGTITYKPPGGEPQQMPVDQQKIVGAALSLANGSAFWKSMMNVAGGGSDGPGPRRGKEPTKEGKTDAPATSALPVDGAAPRPAAAAAPAEEQSAVATNDRPAGDMAAPAQGVTATEGAYPVPAPEPPARFHDPELYAKIKTRADLQAYNAIARQQDAEAKARYDRDLKNWQEEKKLWIEHRDDVALEDRKEAGAIRSEGRAQRNAAEGELRREGLRQEGRRSDAFNTPERMEREAISTAMGAISDREDARAGQLDTMQRGWQDPALDRPPNPNVTRAQQALPTEAGLARAEVAAPSWDRKDVGDDMRDGINVAVAATLNENPDAPSETGKAVATVANILAATNANLGARDVGEAVAHAMTNPDANTVTYNRRTGELVVNIGTRRVQLRAEPEAIREIARMRAINIAEFERRTAEGNKKKFADRKRNLDAQAAEDEYLANQPSNGSLNTRTQRLLRERNGG